MANQNSTQYAKLLTVPATKLKSQEQGAPIRKMVLDITPSAEIDVTDTVFMGKIYRGSVIHNVKMVGAGGSSGVIQLGFAASDNGKNVADLNALADGVSSATAIAVNEGAGSALAGINAAPLSDDCDIVLTATTITVAMANKKLTVEIEYSNS